MKYASPKQRVLSFVLDSLILVSLVFFIARIVWEVLPETEIKHGGMLAYRDSDFRNFFVSAGLCTITFLWYHLVFPLGEKQATIGQRVFKVFIGQPDGSRLALKNTLKRFVIIAFKALNVFLIGPMLAIWGGHFSLTWIGLILPVAVFLVLAIKAWQDEEGAWLLERFGGYRYFSREP